LSFARALNKIFKEINRFRPFRARWHYFIFCAKKTLISNVFCGFSSSSGIWLTEKKHEVCAQ
jgi:hypothetical protein